MFKTQFDLEFPDSQKESLFISPEETLKLMDAGMPLDASDYQFIYYRRSGDDSDKWTLARATVPHMLSFTVDVIPALSVEDFFDLLPVRIKYDEESEEEHLLLYPLKGYGVGKAYCIAYANMNKSMIDMDLSVMDVTLKNAAYRLLLRLIEKELIIKNKENNQDIDEEKD